MAGGLEPVTAGSAPCSATAAPDLRVVAGAVAVGDHPHVLAGVHVDGGDAAVGGLEQGQPPRALGGTRGCRGCSGRSCDPGCRESGRPRTSPSPTARRACRSRGRSRPRPTRPRRPSRGAAGCPCGRRRRRRESTAGCRSPPVRTARRSRRPRLAGSGLKSTRVSTEMPCTSNAAGFVGNGWVGEIHSPGVSEPGTGRSTMGHTGSPVTRSNV